MEGKKKLELFNAIREYVDARIYLKTLPVRPYLNQEEVEKRATETGNNLKKIIMEWD